MKVNRNELIDAYREAIRKDVPLEWVLEQQEQILQEKQEEEKKRSVWRDVPFLITMLIGLSFIAMAVMPMLSFLWSDGDSLWEKSLIAPIPAEKVLGMQVLAAEGAPKFSPLDWIQNRMAGQESKTTSNHAVQFADGITEASNNLSTSTNDPGAPLVIEDQLDYRNLANWFASNDEFFNNHLTDRQVQFASGEYLLDIPKLGVNNAIIKIGGTNLSANLVQYETTAMPGEYGGPSIFGHSTLRQWYNPSENNPERYMSIFSTIMTLEKGDKIMIKYNGMTYTYQVLHKQNVKPTDRDKLVGQDMSGRFLKLITCTPEGTTAMRGIITAVLLEE